MQKAFRSILFVVAVLFFIVSCGQVATSVPLTPTPAIAAPSTGTAAPAPTAPAPGTPSVADQLAQIDSILQQSINANIAYNKPQSMLLDETTTVELLLNPSLSPQALSTQVTASGQVASASVQITPRMKATLLSDDPQAFSIQPVQNDPEQLVSGTETTRWAWEVTARKSGTQRLTLILYRLVQFQGQDYWREVKSYQDDIEVKVTFTKRIGSLDWGWIAGILLTALLIPAFWRWMDQRRKKAASNPKKKSLRS
jgi:hypothetical protein